MLNMLQPKIHIISQSTNVEEQIASSSDKAAPSVQSKHLPAKTVPCVPKKELQFSNTPNPTHIFLSTLTTKSTVRVDTDPVSISLQSRPSPSLMSQSMTKELVQHTKLPQILLDAMSA